MTTVPIIKPDPEPLCHTCEGTGKAERGWSGNLSRDGETCPDCDGTGIDQTPCGTGGDWCAWCGADWKRPHDFDCMVREN
jgi:DnaJ-class molecular chaperone